MLSARAVNEDALKDVDFETPEPVGNYQFVQDRITKVKEDVEDATGQKFSTFKAIKFIKKDFKYKIRVDCGEDRYIDVKLRQVLFQDLEPVNQLDDPMAF